MHKERVEQISFFGCRSDRLGVHRGDKDRNRIGGWWHFPVRDFTKVKKWVGSFWEDGLSPL